MGGQSSKMTNKSMVDRLVEQHHFIRSPKIEAVFRAVDRAMYFDLEDGDSSDPYEDDPWRRGNLHLSAPCIYAKVVESLEFRPGMSFLNLGSGTGYLNTIVGLLVGPNGLNHGIEFHQDVVEYANKRLQQFKELSYAIDEFDFSEPHFVAGNFLDVDPENRYDRIYLGAACLPEFERIVMEMMNPNGGILVMPCDNRLIKHRRLSENHWESDIMMNVNFTLMIGRDPMDSDDGPVISLPGKQVNSLKEICRISIRQYLRNKTELIEPNLRYSDNIRARRIRRSIAKQKKRAAKELAKKISKENKAAAKELETGERLESNSSSGIQPDHVSASLPADQNIHQSDPSTSSSSTAGQVLTRSASRRLESAQAGQSRPPASARDETSATLSANSRIDANNLDSSSLESSDDSDDLGESGPNCGPFGLFPRADQFPPQANNPRFNHRLLRYRDGHRPCRQVLRRQLLRGVEQSNLSSGLSPIASQPSIIMHSLATPSEDESESSIGDSQSPSSSLSSTPSSDLNGYQYISRQVAISWPDLFSQYQRESISASNSDLSSSNLGDLSSVDADDNITDSNSNSNSNDLSAGPSHVWTLKAHIKPLREPHESTRRSTSNSHHVNGRSSRPRNQLSETITSESDNDAGSASTSTPQPRPDRDNEPVASRLRSNCPLSASSASAAGSASTSRANNRQSSRDAHRQPDPSEPGCSRESAGERYIRNRSDKSKLRSRLSNSSVELNARNEARKSKASSTVRQASREDERSSRLSYLSANATSRHGSDYSSLFTGQVLISTGIGATLSLAGADYHLPNPGLGRCSGSFRLFGRRLNSHQRFHHHGHESGVEFERKRKRQSSSESSEPQTSSSIGRVRRRRCCSHCPTRCSLRKATKMNLNQQLHHLPTNSGTSRQVELSSGACNNSRAASGHEMSSSNITDSCDHSSRSARVADLACQVSATAESSTSSSSSSSSGSGASGSSSRPIPSTRTERMLAAALRNHSRELTEAQVRSRRDYCPAQSNCNLEDGRSKLEEQQADKNRPEESEKRREIESERYYSHMSSFIRQLPLPRILLLYLNYEREV